MNATRKCALLFALVFGLGTVIYAAAPVQLSKLGDSYYLYTNALEVDDSGVARVPSQYQWSVETSWRGTDPNGRDLPDTRVLLRLYDPEKNSTALTAQMELATAIKLQQELAVIITKKQQDPTFQHRPQLYEAQDIPRVEIIGVDEEGVAILKNVAEK